MSDNFVRYSVQYKLFIVLYCMSKYILGRQVTLKILTEVHLTIQGNLTIVILSDINLTLKIVKI